MHRNTSYIDVRFCSIRGKCKARFQEFHGDETAEVINKLSNLRDSCKKLILVFLNVIVIDSCKSLIFSIFRIFTSILMCFHGEPVN